MTESNTPDVYKCESCSEWTNGTFGEHSLCFDCYKEQVQNGTIEAHPVWPINWGRVIEN